MSALDAASRPRSAKAMSSIVASLIGLALVSARSGVAAVLVTALLLTLSARVRLKSPPLWLAALLIGVIQGVAIVPGISRSGSTISLALILSLGYAFAFRFSFLLSIPAVGGAFLLQLMQMERPPESWLNVAIGTAVAALFGLCALWILEKMMKRNRLHLFAGYCAVLALVVFAVTL